MAAIIELGNQLACKNVEISVHENHFMAHEQHQEPNHQHFDYTERRRWLRAAIMGANDGLVSVVSLMMGIGAVKGDVTGMILAGFAGLLAGACSMAIGEFVSICTQLDMEVAQMENRRTGGSEENEEGTYNVKLPNPFQAGIASALTFVVGAMVPLMAAAFIKEHKVRIGVVIAASSLLFLAFGVVGAVAGRSPVGWSCVRIVVGGWMAMAITFSLTMLIGPPGA